jgi:hypothetical protein
MIPALSIGFVPPSGRIGRLVASRQDFTLMNGEACSHIVVALGNGRVIDSTWKWVRIKDEAYWQKRRPEWWAPTSPLTTEEGRVLKSNAYMIEGRIGYSVNALVRGFLLGGYPEKRGHGLFCSYLAAELLLVVRDIDVSTFRKPFQVDPRALYQYIRSHDDFTVRRAP